MLKRPINLRVVKHQSIDILSPACLAATRGSEEIG